MAQQNDEARGIKIDRQSLREVIGIAGGGLAGYGAWLHYPPLGFMVGGGVLILLAVIGTLKGGA